MRKYVLLYLALSCRVTLLAQEKMSIHKSDQTSTELKISSIDSIYFSSDGSYARGISNNGLYTGRTYSTSGATLKKTVSLSSSSTVNTISF